VISERLKNCGTWWRGKDEAERFLLYYSCLREHYQMPANEALAYAKTNWPALGNGDLMTTLRESIRGTNAHH
jgi:hypothetical protein